MYGRHRDTMPVNGLFAGLAVFFNRLQGRGHSEEQQSI
jgi:hypothetical protein